MVCSRQAVFLLRLLLACDKIKLSRYTQYENIINDEMGNAMPHNDLDTIVNSLKLQGEMSFLPAATEAQINGFETNQSVNLPLKFKKWLLRSDGGEFFLPAGVQLYGVAHKPIINVNDNNRPNENYIVIGALSSGDPILCEKTREQISIYNSEAEKIEDDETYPDFIAFLNDLNGIVGIGG